MTIEKFIKNTNFKVSILVLNDIDEDTFEDMLEYMQYTEVDGVPHLQDDETLELVELTPAVVKKAILSDINDTEHLRAIERHNLIASITFDRVSNNKEEHGSLSALADRLGLVVDVVIAKTPEDAQLRTLEKFNTITSFVLVTVQKYKMDKSFKVVTYNKLEQPIILDCKYHTTWQSNPNSIFRLILTTKDGTVILKSHKDGLISANVNQLIFVPTKANLRIADNSGYSMIELEKCKRLRFREYKKISNVQTTT